MKTRIKKTLERFGLLNAAIRVRDYVHSTKFLKTNLRYYLNGAPDGQPIPSLRHIVSVTGQTDIDWFFKSGWLAAESIRETLTNRGLKISDFRAILDFGSGCGRVTRYWRDLKETRIIGMDYNASLIRWCNKNLDFASFQINGLYPPLNLNDDSFDFIYAISVFTHLTQELQWAWMDELRRVLRPDGFLLITTHGENFLYQLNEFEKSSFLSGDLVIRSHGPVGSNRLGAYHPMQYVVTKLIRGFELLEFIQGGAKGNPGQDVYLFQKRPIEDKA